MTDITVSRQAVDRKQHAATVSDDLSGEAWRVAPKPRPAPLIPPNDGDASDGLVISATSTRGTVQVSDQDFCVGDIWQARFPSADLVPVASSLFESLPAWQGQEGPRWRISVGPGCMAVGTRDLARLERTYERHAGYVQANMGHDGSDHRMADLVASHGCHGADAAIAKPHACHEHGCLPHEQKPCNREITGWSRKSRSRMIRTLCELDYSPLVDLGRLLAMITLTYPGDWESVAPDGKTVKAHFRAFQERWYRTWGERLVGIWKLEFQRRGAPHLHIECAPPLVSPDGRGIRDWVRQTWAEIVGAEDEDYQKHVRAGCNVDFNEGLKAKDPKRLAMYFAKHGTYAAKEYQHTVPELWKKPGKGPGRFWGYLGLSKAVSTCEVSPATATYASRTLRRWAHAQRNRIMTETGIKLVPQCRDIQARRIDHDTGELKHRKIRRRVTRLPKGRGWVATNNGPSLAAEVSQYVDEATFIGPLPKTARKWSLETFLAVKGW